MNFYVHQSILQYNVMDEVVIVTDTFNFGLPVGEKGYVAGIDRNSDTAYNYNVRIPSKKIACWVPGCDLMNWDRYVQESVNNAIHKHYVDEALANGDEDMFKQHAKEINENG